MLMKFLKNKKLNRGFSLYETLIAIFILTYTVATAMTLVQKSLSSATYSRDQVVAAYLAQDAIEYIRNLRDESIIETDLANSNTDWMSHLSPCATGGSCRIDTTPEAGSTGNLQVCNGSSCQLNFNASLGEYGYHVTDSSWVASRFFRSFTITDVPNPSGPVVEKIITVTITWNAGPFNQQTYTASEHIFNWGEI